MTEIRAKQNSFLNSPFVFWSIVLLVVAFRVHHEAWYPVVESDYGGQIAAAKNFLDGNGFSACQADASNLDKISCRPLSMWPAGYAMLLVPAYLLLQDWFAACIFWQSAASLLLIFWMYKLLVLFNVKTNILLLFLVFMAFTPTPFYYLAPTDTLSIGIFLWGVYSILNRAKAGYYRWVDFLLLAILSAANCFLRYASIPNLVIFPLYFLIAGFLHKDSRMYTGAFIVFVLSGALAWAYFSVFPIAAGRTSFMNNLLSFNYYYSHLKWFDSFPVKSFYYLRPLEFRLPADNPSLIAAVRLCIHIGSLWFLSLLAFKFIVKDKIHEGSRSPLPARERDSDYFIIFIITSAAIIGFMMLQSLTTPPESNSFGPPWMPKFWTFVYSTRYFTPLMAMLMIAFFVMLARISFRSDKLLSLLSYAFFIPAFIYSLGFWVFTQRQVYSETGNGGGSFWRNYADHVSFFNEINRIEEKESRRVVFTSYDLGRKAPVMLFSKGTPCSSYSKLLAGDLKHTAPLTLLVEMPGQELTETEKKFIDSRRPRKVAGYKHADLYRIDLE